MRTQSVSLLFVCTGNIARSPYAERRARMLLGTSPVEVRSAGIPGYPDRPMDAEMAEQLRLRGGDPTGHVSRRLDDHVLDQADVVLTFAFEHQLRILALWPEASDRIFGVRQFADALERVDASNVDGPTLVTRVRSLATANSMIFDLDDPHRRGRRAAREAAAAIDGFVRVITLALTGFPIPTDRSALGSPRRALPTSSRWHIRRQRPKRAIHD